MLNAFCFSSSLCTFFGVYNNKKIGSQQTPQKSISSVSWQFISLSPDTRRWPPESWSVLEADRDIPAAAAAAAAAFDSGRAVLDSGRASESAVDLLQVWGQCSVQYWLPVHSEWSQPSVR